MSAAPARRRTGRSGTAAAAPPGAGRGVRLSARLDLLRYEVQLRRLLERVHDGDVRKHLEDALLVVVVRGGGAVEAAGAGGDGARGRRGGGGLLDGDADGDGRLRRGDDERRRGPLAGLPRLGFGLLVALLVLLVLFVLLVVLLVLLLVLLLFLRGRGNRARAPRLRPLGVSMLLVAKAPGRRSRSLLRHSLQLRTPAPESGPAREALATSHLVLVSFLRFKAQHGRSVQWP